MWVLERPPSAGSDIAVHPVLLMDATQYTSTQGSATAVDWLALNNRITDAVRSGRDSVTAAGPTTGAPPGVAFVQPVSLLDDIVDITPARHVPSPSLASTDFGSVMPTFSSRLSEVTSAFDSLSSLKIVKSQKRRPTASIGELERAAAVQIDSGQIIEGGVEPGGDGAVAVLTIADLLQPGRARTWVDAEYAHKLATSGALALADAIVVGVERAYRAWVHEGSPVLLGPQLFGLRPDNSYPDAWFLAGCLRAPANVRQAGTHTSAASRIDVRRLQVLQLPVEQQRHYGNVFKTLATLDESLQGLGAVGGEVMATLSHQLGTGRSELR